MTVGTAERGEAPAVTTAAPIPISGSATVAGTLRGGIAEQGRHTRGCGEKRPTGGGLSRRAASHERLAQPLNRSPRGEPSGRAARQPDRLAAEPRAGAALDNRDCVLHCPDRSEAAAALDEFGAGADLWGH